jgi:hypothetical protein
MYRALWDPKRLQKCGVTIITENGCVLTDILYSHTLDKHNGMTNIKKKYTLYLL